MELVGCFLSVRVGGAELGSSVVFAIICAIVAASKGRSALGWGLIGFFLSCIGLIILLCMSDLNEEAARGDGIDRDVRRLKERLKQDRIHRKDFEATVQQRLDAHDAALGLDTRPPEIAGGTPTARIGAEPPAWYYEEHGEQAGPVSRSALVALIRSGALTADTLVWTEGMEDWTPLSEVDELKA